MNDLPSLNNVQPEPLDRDEARRQRRAARHAATGGLGWVAGLIMIVLGGVFLLYNMGALSITLHNWWALFILIPALGSFDTAWRAYRAGGNRLTATARGAILAGVILTAITLAFLLELDWTYFGPILLILAGVGVLINFLIPGQP
jgi:hypothetical protein